MIVDPQTVAITLMSDPATHGGTSVEQNATHISRIFLAGDRAWKMKRAVKLPHVDFSRPDQRFAACLKEVEPNARTAPGRYIGVHELRCSSNSRLILDSEGELIRLSSASIRIVTESRCGPRPPSRRAPPKRSAPRDRARTTP